MSGITKSTGSRPQNIRQSNCRAVMNLLTSSNISTIGELSDAMQLSRTATQNILAILLGLNMITSVGKGESSDLGGKKPSLYAINPSYKYCIHVLMGIGYAVAELYDFSLHKVDYSIVNSIDRSYSSWITSAVQSISDLMRDTNVTGDMLFGIVISASGTVDGEQKVLFKPMDALDSWPDELHVVEDIQAILNLDVPMYMDNLCHFSGYSELLRYPGNSVNSFFYLLAHNIGVGGTFVNNGKLIRGTHGLVGEVGHITIDYKSNVRCRCGRSGCFEAMVSSKAIAERANEELAAGIESILEPGSVDNVLDLFNAAEKGDQFARSQLDILAEQFAAVINTIQISYDPDVVIIHGAYSAPCDYFRSKLDHLLESGSEHGIVKKPSVFFDDSDFIRSIKEGSAFFCREQFFSQDNIFA